MESGPKSLLMLIEEPRIVAASESQRVPGGNKTTFWCEIKGYPLPTVTWYYFAPGGSYEAILLPGKPTVLFL